MDYTNIPPKTIAQRYSDALDYVKTGFEPDYTMQHSKDIFWDLVKTKAIPDWEAKNGRSWTLAEVKNQGKHTAKPWTDQQRKSIEERLTKRLQGLGNRLGRSPEELSLWLDKVRSLYEISDNNDQVMSYAKEYRMKNGQPQVWPVANESEAEDKIVQLLEWKISGRSVGRGDIDNDLGGQAPLQ